MNSPAHPAGVRPVSAACIRVRGARAHNLQNIDVDVPRDKLVVITGVSGSGKSSLAFDTLFAEGQRRYLETLSSQTRAYLDQMQRPDVDDIDGLPPVLSIEQRVTGIQPRSTLATTTEIHDFLRLLFARAGTAHCPQCGRELAQQSTQAIVDSVLALEAGRKAMILAPLVRGKKGAHRELFEKICREGFVRARVDGQLVDASTPPEMKKSKPHDIDVIVDRIVVKEGLRARLFESVELALRHGNGTCIISHEENSSWHERLFSSRFACPDCQLSLSEIEPRTFSFNSPYGACPTCQGMGTIDSATAVVDLSDRRICPECHGARIGPVGRAVTFAGMPIHSLLALTVEAAERAVAGFRDATSVSPQARLVAARILPEIARRLEFLRRVGLDYLSLDRPTPTLSGGEFQRARIAGCLGAGLIGVGYILDEPTIGLHPRDTHRLLETLHELRDRGNSVIVVEHDLDVMLAADYLIDLGPGAGRDGGQVVSCGTPREVMASEQSLTGRFLRSRLGPGTAATVAVRARRRAVDLGRSLTVVGAGARNLKNLRVAFPLGVLTCVTGVSGSGKSTLVMETLVPLVRAALAVPPPQEQGAAGKRPGSLFSGRDAASAMDPVPESQARAPAVSRASGGPPDRPASEGGTQSRLEPERPAIDRLVEIDQSPLGKNARSNPATASGMWDEIRRVFARTRDARVKGFRAARFSFNAPGGRCEECRGQGVRRVSMQFLPDIEVVCPACRGARFNPQTLQVKFRGRSAADVLDMRIDEAARFFANFAAVSATLQTFVDVGLGYLTLGQSATTLSGGEAQRIKLASELSRRAPGPALYVLDEPTTGLHPADVARLLELLERLVDEGHTVVVIEHHLDVIARADWVIDLGPEGGDAGGHVVAAGPPLEIARTPNSHTGAALRAAGFLAAEGPAAQNHPGERPA